MKLSTSILWMFIGSFIIGYTITSAILVETAEHIENSLTKFYTAIFMALWMVVLEIIMFTVIDMNFNNLIILLPVIGFLILFGFLIRDQIGINDDNYLKAMIQHHSSAILTSKEILKKTKNVNVKELAEQIIKSQEIEIKIMKNMI